MRPGDRPPSFGEMRAQYGTSLATVDRALSILEKEGLIVRVNGSDAASEFCTISQMLQAVHQRDAKTALTNPAASVGV